MTATAYRLLRGEHGGAVDAPSTAPKPATEAAHALLLEHLWLVPVRCRALRVRGPARDDAEQDGRLALWRAAVRFDPKRGVPFEHYARVWIDNAIKACLGGLGPVRTPVKVVSARAARGERAHPATLPYLEAATDESVALVREIAEHASVGGEEGMVDRIDQMRATRWLLERLAEFPPSHAEALMALGLDMSPREYARKAGAGRESTRLRTKAGLEYLREEAERYLRAPPLARGHQDADSGLSEGEPTASWPRRAAG